MFRQSVLLRSTAIVLDLAVHHYRDKKTSTISPMGRRNRSSFVYVFVVVLKLETNIWIYISTYEKASFFYDNNNHKRNSHTCKWMSKHNNINGKFIGPIFYTPRITDLCKIQRFGRKY